MPNPYFMQLIRDIKPDLFPKGCVLAIGNFDGVHLGHQGIIRECIARARALGVPAVVMSFEPHPREFFGRAGEPLRLSSPKQKAQLLAALGIDALLLMRFNQQLASTSAENFVSSLLVKTLGVRHVVTGQNFAFGKGRGGGSDFLTEQARTQGFGFTACAPVMSATSEVISSSAIRAALKEGDLETARTMLGGDYVVGGHVIHGEKRGRTIGFPTMNLALKKRFVPRKGVYAAKMEVAGKRYDAVVNIGIKPTFGAHAPLLEAHAFGLEGDMYGRYACLALKAFLRDEMRYESLDLLKAQIAHDANLARQLLAS